MQAYPQPQPPAQNITPPQNMALQKLWWLIYGLSFGVGIVIFDAIYNYGIAPLLLRMNFDLALYILSEDQDPLLYLIFFVACLVAGILVARRTRRAGSATLASLLVGLCFLIGELILAVSTHRGVILGYSYILSNDILVTCLGIYVGFLGGLIGRTTERSRRTIGILYAVGVLLVSLAVPFLVANTFLLVYHGYGLYSFLGADGVYVVISPVLGGLCSMVAWIMTLIQYARVQSWGAFTLTFFFSGVMVLVYLIVGAQPQQPAQYVVLQPGAYAPGAVAYQPMQPAPAQPSQPDAVAILQQRFARGEITEETYRQMLATLTTPPQQ